MGAGGGTKGLVPPGRGEGMQNGPREVNLQNPVEKSVTRTTTRSPSGDCSSLHMGRGLVLGSTQLKEERI